MKIYTKTGDQGETGLVGGTRVRKDDALVDVLGNLDELNSAIGIALTHALPPLVQARLSHTQHAIFEAGAEMARSSDASLWPVATAALEQEIDVMTETLPLLRHFILPGGTSGASAIHLARSICRRTERSLVPVVYNSERHSPLLAYLNRLSDWLFCAARFANQEQGVEDVRWNKQ
jgi:cob(I)alamin adenosyltransferase